MGGGVMNNGWMFDPQRALVLVSAFAGSVIALFVQPNVGRWQAIGIVITGLIGAYFGTTYVSGFLPPGDGLLGLVGCLFGMLTFSVAGRAIGLVRRGRLPYIGKEGRDDS